MAMSCDQITPISAFQSTNLSSKIDSFSRLGQRITRFLGAPMVNIEIHSDQLYEAISQACEMFTEYAGYTEENLIFDSNLYIDGYGIPLDQLFSITPYFNRINQPNFVTVYAALCSLPATLFTTDPGISAQYITGIFQNQILAQTDYLSATTSTYVSAAYIAYTAGTMLSSTPITSLFLPSMNNQAQIVNSFDYDTMDYRKIMSVYNFEEGSNDGVNTLFTIEQTLAQQTYFSYSMGNYGYDLVSWYVLKDWLNIREKLLAQRRAYDFDPRTQLLVLYPPPRTPGSGSRFWGTISCTVERPLRDIIKERWVFQYALAIAKTMVGNVRTKYSGTQLFGGGTINGGDLASQGMAEMDKLQQQLYESAPAAGAAAPPMFFVG